ncbi:MULTISPECIES: DUF397 domain-containing protein [Streptomyces]|uniref:DUF397 domain-containing protein n=1 Tax=Streptomyces lycii TaxID=2654337 RepID=A0ABQ7FGR0_9ACTN|nr:MULTISPECIES: DUF397 domain-containing protein [Streptomyces]KAF4407748.1 DUF397 domain-containing protein [Streptomyces lycii]PGH51546.1 DUF397 domain-containing protein [Streptomyces sp. Ru87]
MRKTPESAGSAGASWRKSSHSGAQGGECVEIAVSGAPAARVAVRDSKDPDGPRLTVGSAAWADFLRFAAPRG